MTKSGDGNVFHVMLADVVAALAGRELGSSLPDDERKESPASRAEHARADAVIFSAHRAGRVSLMGYLRAAGTQNYASGTVDRIPNEYFLDARCTSGDSVCPDIWNEALTSAALNVLRSHPVWEEVRVSKEDFALLLALRDQGAQGGAAAGELTKDDIATGRPGRPSSMPHIIREASRIAGSDGVSLLEFRSKVAFAKTLSAWLADTHPLLDPVSSETIRKSRDIASIWRKRPVK